MTRMVVKNMKFNTSQTEDIIQYIESRYPELIKKTNKNDRGKIELVEFNDGVIIQPREEVPFQNNSKKMIRENGNFFIVSDESKTEMTIGKNEFIFDELVKQVQKANPDDKLTTSKKSIPYIQANIINRKVPLIIFLWQQQGLLEALMRMGIDFDIGNDPKEGRQQTTIKLEEGFLFIYPENRRQELITNGLLQLPKSIRLTNDSLNDRHALDTYLMEKHGSRTIDVWDKGADKMIDPTTKALLEFEEHPTEYVDILTGPLLDKLLNDSPDHPADLKNLRVRQAEVFTSGIYDQLSISHNTYLDSMNKGNEEAKMRMDENYIINKLLGRHRDSRNDGGALLEFVAPFSPVIL